MLTNLDVPASIEIFGTTIKVELIENFIEIKNRRGEWCPLQDKIKLQAPKKGLSMDDFVNSFLHELIEAILEKTNLTYSSFKDHNEKEIFINILSGCLHQAFKTAKYGHASRKEDWEKGATNVGNIADAREAQL